MHRAFTGLVVLVGASTLAACSGRSLIVADTGALDVASDASDTVDSSDIAHDSQDARIDIVDIADTRTDAVDAVPDATDTLDDAAIDVPPDVPMGPAFCSLSGGGTVMGATVPAGFCIRRWAERDAVRAPRTIAFAPNGDLFVASPVIPGAGCYPNTEACGQGTGSILVVRDGDGDGTAEVHTFASGLPDVHGLAVSATAIYFTTAAGVWRTDYAEGQLDEVASSRVQLAPWPSGSFRFTHGLSRSVGGHLYATAGVGGATCPDPDPIAGAVFEVGTGSMRMLAHGFRNPMYTRCHFADEVCALDELGDDGGSAIGAREKFILLRDATNYGYPCCATRDMPSTMASCATVDLEEANMPLNDTPFGLDWERGAWSGTYAHGVFVAKHGSFYHSPRWRSAGIWWAPANPSTHAPTGEFTLLVGGFAEASPELRRAVDVAFAPDGRLFFADDYGGIYWVAPDTLRSR